MSEVTFAQLCEATGKTDEEIGELAGVKPGTVKAYRKTNKPSHALKDAVGRLLAGTPMETPIVAPAPSMPSMEAIAIDREMIPTDFEDNEDWHFVRCQDSGPGGTERVRADVAQLKAGITQKGGKGGNVYCRYSEAHRFSDNFVVMKCPMAQYLGLESAAQAHAAAQWPESQKGSGDGISTETKRETRFIEGAAGAPTGEPVSA